MHMCIHTHKHTHRHTHAHTHTPPSNIHSFNMQTCTGTYSYTYTCCTCLICRRMIFIPPKILSCGHDKQLCAHVTHTSCSWQVKDQWCKTDVSLRLSSCLKQNQLACMYRFTAHTWKYKWTRQETLYSSICSKWCRGGSQPTLGGGGGMGMLPRVHKKWCLTTYNWVCTTQYCTSRTF